MRSDLPEVQGDAPQPGGVPLASEHTALVMAKMHRTEDGEWRMSAIGRPASGQMFQELLPAVIRHL
ncbi:hypothetical protein ACNPQM_09655 [Streptomyces sp. NPDC056231]|uniref:hypothetical protein n=1 Tax=Streptomyces sp. NPDC056231 TaxID=3345755 RepID=UPI003AAD8E08